MSVALHDALENVDLQVGQTYGVEVKGRWIELRVLADRPSVPHRAEPMLDPWYALGFSRCIENTWRSTLPTPTAGLDCHTRTPPTDRHRHNLSYPCTRFDDPFRLSRHRHPPAPCGTPMLAVRYCDCTEVRNPREKANS